MIENEAEIPNLPTIADAVDRELYVLAPPENMQRVCNYTRKNMHKTFRRLDTKILVRTCLTINKFVFTLNCVGNAQELKLFDPEVIICEKYPGLVE